MNQTALRAADLSVGYSSRDVVHHVDVDITPGTVTALVGPNGSGKSTLLRSLVRLQRRTGGTLRLQEPPRHSALASTKTSATASAPAPAPAQTTTTSPTLDQDADDLSAKDFARRVTLLAQSRPHAGGLSVHDVVAFGRHPHRRRFSGLSQADQDAIDRALVLTGLAELAARPVERLSGGELQRVWLASCLAQDTAVVLLDEPTNHLDLRYQVETLDLIRELAEDHAVAVGVVLHDLDHAAAVADSVILLQDGRVHASGAVGEVLTSEHLSQVYGLPIRVETDPDTGRPRISATGRRVSSA